ncbi:MAG: DUF3019 domain-containing protein [Gammaproteobacteria bacterium]
MRYLIVLLFTLPALADEPKPRLTVQPKLCIVDKRTPVCDVTFDVEWTSPVAGDYCVKRLDDDEPLRCWVEEDAGQVDDQRPVSKTFRYDLQEEGETRVSTKVEILKMDGEDRRRRRRTRHVWDVL